MKSPTLISLPTCLLAICVPACTGEGAGDPPSKAEQAADTGSDPGIPDRDAPDVPPPPAVSAPEPGNDAKAVEVLETYSGVCWVGAGIPGDPVETMMNFPIYSRADFEKFIGRIPKGSPSKTNPPPKNDDPLLEKPEIDFEKNMALVLLYPDTLSSVPRVLSIREDATAMWVKAEHPAKPPGEAYPVGMGAYTLVVIPYSGEIKTLRFEIGGD